MENYSTERMKKELQDFSESLRGARIYNAVKPSTLQRAQNTMERLINEARTNKHRVMLKVGDLAILGAYPATGAPDLRKIESLLTGNSKIVLERAHKPVGPKSGQLVPELHVGDYHTLLPFRAVIETIKDGGELTLSEEPVIVTHTDYPSIR
jgi:hypothetical protein